MPPATPQQALLLFRVGPVYCCASTAPVETIIVPPGLTHPPGASLASPGIFQHAGKLIRARDLRILFGIDSPTPSAMTRVILTQHERGAIGYWVDEIVGIIAMPLTGFGPLPAPIPRGIFSHTFIHEQRIYLYGEFAQLATLTRHGYLRSYIEQLTANAHAAVTITAPAISQPQSTASPAVTTTTVVEPTLITPPTPPWPQQHSPSPALSDAKRITSQPTKLAPRHSSSTHTAIPPAPVDSARWNTSTLVTHPSRSAATFTATQHQAAINTPMGSGSATAPPLPESRFGFLLPVIVLLVILGGTWWLLSWSSTAGMPPTHPLVADTPMMSTRVADGVIPPPTAVPATPNPYTAEIHPDNAGITIVLKAPVQEHVLTRPTDTPTHHVSVNEIVHIVKKGDTLWDIAARYVNDPYRYPELATLSRIKNPDLIYPGNRVRIIQQ